ncbi:GNAT family N-acetyltransferase [Shewanella eurypsychrophilus]|uniref:GNAT family N-acetyltransferase n=1 Tax=Shewanella eurypsychrophilus TaxID=2593656 RepID=A0ABX6V7W8_9GAMM|nr:MULTISPECIES: GNAT family N-acetyltransferase [Shewanella]QFU22366.1 GNAT family N-acetyltransferase [Shewanella sp. YLB-09]QPG57653.1 GNAT family N-acetyltransferase [Shewanella eurypsychrophilus]
MIVLETTRLRLRHVRLTDAEFILELLNTPGFIDNIGDRGVRDLLQAETYLIDGPISSYQQNGFGLYLVERKESGEAIGLCGLVKRPQLDEPDLGYAFLPAFWGKGYAIESSLAVVEYSKRLAISQLLGIVSPGNDPSIAVLEKLGMVFDSVLHWDEDDSEVLLYRLNIY